MKKLKEFNWVVPQSEDHSDWGEFLKWMNETAKGRNKYNGKKRKYYGFTGKVKAADSVKDLPRNTEILTMELWLKLYLIENVSPHIAKLYEEKSPFYIPISSQEDWDEVTKSVPKRFIYDIAKFRAKNTNHIYFNTYEACSRAGLNDRNFEDAGYNKVSKEGFILLMELYESNANRDQDSPDY